MIHPEQFKSWFFDCDGVLLDSNQIKTQGFYEVALPFGHDAAAAIRDYHVSNGGVSRFKKMSFFITDILKKQFDEKLHKELTDSYGRYCFNKMIETEETPKLRNILAKINNKHNCFVVSGGSETELLQIFKIKGMDKYFKGIFGSPRDKMQIFSDLLAAGQIISPAVFVGDSKYDYTVAEKFGLNFIFMTQFTEFKEWQTFFANKDVLILKNFAELSFSEK